MANKAYFRSSFICEVKVDDKLIELVDSVHQSFFIDKTNSSLMAEFKQWFKDVYSACVPQTLTVLQYDIEDDETGPLLKVVKLIYKKSDKKTEENA